MCRFDKILVWIWLTRRLAPEKQTCHAPEAWHAIWYGKGFERRSTYKAVATVADELAEWADGADITPALERIGLVEAQRRHPYDLSGGQQQLLALEKLLLAHPRLLLLDEPTKGLDEAYRSQVAQVVREAAEQGVTVILATHDLAFARAVAHSVTLLFDGQAVVTMPCEEFFASTWTYRSEGL